ncbi:MAG: TPM domain-containing protein [Bacteroidota bacterium]
MKKRNYLYTVIALLLFVFPLGVQAADDLPVPDAPSAWVNDYAGAFSRSEGAQLNEKLAAFEQRSSTQIFVVTLSDSKGYEPGDLAQRIGEKWKVGQQGKDNGIVILIDVNAHKTFVSTGYGVEEFVTDAVSKRIVEQEMLPSFRAGNYYEGVNKAIDVLINLLDGNFTADQYVSKSSSGQLSKVISIIVMIIIFGAIFGGRNRRSVGMGRSNLPLWIALGMLNSGRGSGGSWGGFSGGGGGFGGGGFSGGGGGSFGGGGAGGSW